MIEKTVENIIKKPIEDLGYILDEVLYLKEDGNYFLRVVIDKVGIIDIEDCIKVTKVIDPLLDDVEINTRFTLFWFNNMPARPIDKQTVEQAL